jgi:hypothetical protein
LWFSYSIFMCSRPLFIHNDLTTAAYNRNRFFLWAVRCGAGIEL